MKTIRLIAILFSFFFLLNVQAQKRNKQVLLKIDDNEITVDEFLKAYNKSNNNNIDYPTTTINDYLDLYINYRLKVIEAKSLKMDTISRLKEELDGYAKKLAEPYLFDQKINNDLLNEAYQRLLIDVRVSHILIACAENANPSDTLKAYQKIIDLKKRAINNESFEQLAAQYSDDLSARDQTDDKGRIIKKGNAGDLGYFSVFDMVYPFENAAYGTSLGSVSDPIRTRFGYHLVKTTDRHEALGNVSVAHLFLANNTTINDQNSQKDKIFEIYKRLNQGENFEKLVFDYSEDRTTKTNKGILPTLGANQMVPSFYLAIFSIDNIGGYSEPIQTPYGWHIIKLIERNRYGSFEDEKNVLTNELIKDSRSQISKTAKLNRFKNELGIKLFSKAKDELFSVIDSSILNGNWDLSRAKGFNQNLLKIGKQYKTQFDFAEYINNNQVNNSSPNLMLLYDKLYHDFVNMVCEQYFYDHLTDTQPEYSEIMEEYRNGVLLFELMEEKIWKKSMSDEKELNEFFNQNQLKYSDSEFKEVKGLVISDYQRYLEDNWIKELKNKYSISINKKALSPIL
ncbi:MAG: peptidylprolyl isomerase [Bacteroidetes bacterium]|nr:peptidylprolyl isomerase [Bacteroidota bacterium]